jgi:hypothetical protein
MTGSTKGMSNLQADASAQANARIENSVRVLRGVGRVSDMRIVACSPPRRELGKCRLKEEEENAVRVRVVSDEPCRGRAGAGPPARSVWGVT